MFYFHDCSRYQMAIEAFAFAWTFSFVLLCFVLKAFICGSLRAAVRQLLRAAAVTLH